MMSLPNSKEEWVSFLKRWGGVLFRVKILWALVGAAVTIFVQLLTGFWEFREQHQAQIAHYYNAAIEQNQAFESQLTRLNQVFDGNKQASAGIEYSNVAQDYIIALQDVTRLLPSTEESFQNYVDAIASLRQYYAVENPPAMGSEEWMLFYGRFRGDYNDYVVARDTYFELLASEIGSYWRYIGNV